MVLFLITHLEELLSPRAYIQGHTSPLIQHLIDDVQNLLHDFPTTAALHIYRSAHYLTSLGHYV